MDNPREIFPLVWLRDTPNKENVAEQGPALEPDPEAGKFQINRKEFRAMPSKVTGDEPDPKAKSSTATAGAISDEPSIPALEVVLVGAEKDPTIPPSDEPVETKTVGSGLQLVATPLP